MKSARCLCEGVRFSFEPAEPESAACHCSMCRRWTGGVFISVQAPESGFELQQQETLARYASSPWAERAFCNRCGSSLWYRVTAPGPHEGNLYIGLGTLDDASGLDLEREIFIDRKPDNYSFEGPTEQLTEAQVMAEFAG